MLNEKSIKIIGIATSIVGMGVSVAADWVGEKKMDITIEKKIAEALAKINKG